MAADGGLSGRQPKAVQSALAVLECVARLGAGVTAKEVAESLGMPPATVYRLLNLLVGEQYLVRLPDLSGFALGRKVAGLAGAIAPVRVPSAARAVLADLRKEVRAGVHLILYTATTLRVADMDPDLPLQDPALVERHLHATAAGKLLLAEQPEWRDLVPPAKLTRLMRATVTRPDALDACLTRVRADNWAGQAGELHEGTACLAVPVRDAEGSLIAGVAVTSSRFTVSVDYLPSAYRFVDGLVPLLT
ncbi:MULTISPECIES: IclR family transcriptional regulator [unclassified Modestobacter]|uniref:IclR family transcriptional regulator n=1 Tax=unclassified Modestobacter TaxID=2643866 RepID=UPI0022AB364D|nr:MULTISPECIES: IclR family transcriptional regulator C-terminal domain-containing protein [unclassified Modestobacter]MCZ2826684.1 helix-turn-helix domain-containing protein [Modestobacter sp. VKM Ac-2981]MCZ2855064.1 helix-turn-helix domain-containing protein [Modestobacter sp. VKM Ac-2982]